MPSYLEIICKVIESAQTQHVLEFVDIIAFYITYGAKVLRINMDIPSFPTRTLLGQYNPAIL